MSRCKQKIIRSLFGDQFPLKSIDPGLAACHKTFSELEIWLAGVGRDFFLLSQRSPLNLFSLFSIPTPHEHENDLFVV